jgi:hypothetical protein
MTDKQKAFLERNKYRKNIGNCVICKKPTTWNEEKGRYDRFCSDACVKKYVEIRNKRVLDKYGTTNLASIPDFQKDKLMANRGIAKTYTFKDGGRKIVLSNIEYKILEYLDSAGYTSEDIEAPASIVIPYRFEGKNLNHIPDIFVRPLNLIISGKDGLDNPNMSPHFLKDRKKNIAIFKEILDNYNLNYVQVEGEKEVKALESTMLTIQKLMKKNGRVVIPPRIDFALYSESMKHIKHDDAMFRYFKNFVVYNRNGVLTGFFIDDCIYYGTVYTRVNNMLIGFDTKNDENFRKNSLIFYAGGEESGFDLRAINSYDRNVSVLASIAYSVLGTDIVENETIENWIERFKDKFEYETLDNAISRAEKIDAYDNLLNIDLGTLEEIAFNIEKGTYDNIDKITPDDNEKAWLEVLAKRVENVCGPRGDKNE